MLPAWVCIRCHAGFGEGMEPTLDDFFPARTCPFCGGLVVKQVWGGDAGSATAVGPERLS